MGDDEAARGRAINPYRYLMTVLVRGRRGRMVDFTGDNPLAEFASVVDPVPCAMDFFGEPYVTPGQVYLLRA